MDEEDEAEGWDDETMQEGDIRGRHNIDEPTGKWWRCGVQVT